LENLTDSLKVLTYNAWGLKIGPFSIAKDYFARIYSLASEIYQLKPDIILLQEIWKKTDRDFIISEFVKRGYRYSFHKSGNHPHVNKLKKQFRWLNNFMLGNGLLIISKLPIDLTTTKAISFEGYTAQEEFFTRKGAIYCEIKSKDFGKISLINAHLGSVDYQRNKNRFRRDQIKTQKKQLLELEDFIQKHSGSNPLFIGADLNIDEGNYNSSTWFPRSGKQYQNLISKLNLIDSFRFHHPDDLGHTYTSKNIYNSKQETPGSRVDYLFHKNIEQRFEPESSNIVFSKPIKKFNNQIHLSDHFGILSEYKIINKGA